MEPRTDVLVIVLAGLGLGLLVGHTAAEATDPPRAAETVAQGQVAPLPTDPAADRTEPATGPEPTDSSAAASLLVPGRTVRVSLSSATNDDDDEQLEGTLVDADESSLRIRRGNRVVTVPWPTIRRLEVAMTRNPSWMWLPIATGAGLGIGYVLSLADTMEAGCMAGCNDGRTPQESDRRLERRVLGGAAVGLAIGVLISQLHRRPAGWTDVPPERVRVSLVPVVERCGFGLTIAVGF